MRKVVLCSVVAAGVVGLTVAAILMKNMCNVCEYCHDRSLDQDIDEEDKSEKKSDPLEGYSTKDFFDEIFPDAEPVM